VRSDADVVQRRAGAVWEYCARRSFDLDDKGEGSEIEVDTHHRLAGAAVHDLACRSRQSVLTTKHKKPRFQAIGAPESTKIESSIVTPCNPV
jgi:hypothetical protein